MKKKRLGTKAERHGESTRYPGVYKWDVTYEDLTGEIKTEPAYAKNMLEAVRKVDRRLRYEDLKRTIGKYFAIALVVFTIMAISTVGIIMAVA